jgi:hypothetical protein
MSNFNMSELRQFTGSEQFYRHWLRSIVYTEGVHYLAEKAGAHWLLDVIASWQLDRKVKAEPFQVWKLKVNADSTAVVTCEDGDGKTVATQTLEFTDFPKEGVELWFTDNTILLPSEH